MVQESVKLNKNLLKHLRNKKAESQEETAQACFVSLRQYQNIERTGCTTSKVIDSIAKHFNITSHELITTIEDDDSLWYITDPYSAIGSICHSYSSAIESIISRLQPRGYGEAQIRITDTLERKDITIYAANEEFKWSMRPIELNENIGFVWKNLSDWQEDEWKITRHKLLYNYVDNSFLNGKSVVPEGCSVKYIIYFSETGAGRIVDTGHRIFDSDSEFICSLYSWLDSVAMYAVLESWRVGIVGMTYDFIQGITKSIYFGKVYVSNDAKFYKAPWSISEQKRLVELIEKKQKLVRNNNSSICNGITSPIADVKPFEPEVVYERVTEIPDSFHENCFRSMNISFAPL